MSLTKPCGCPMGHEGHKETCLGDPYTAQMIPGNVEHFQLAPDPEVAEEFSQRREARPFVPDRAYLVALGYLSYIKGDTSKESVMMLAELLKSWGYNG